MSAKQGQKSKAVLIVVIMTPFAILLGLEFMDILLHHGPRKLFTKNSHEYSFITAFIVVGLLLGVLLMNMAGAIKYVFTGSTRPFFNFWGLTCRRVDRGQTDLCAHCGYSMRGISSGQRCPECGQLREGKHEGHV